jgi:hypothetical protein
LGECVKEWSGDACVESEKHACVLRGATYVRVLKEDMQDCVSVSVCIENRHVSLCV